MFEVTPAVVLGIPERGAKLQVIRRTSAWSAWLFAARSIYRLQIKIELHRGYCETPERAIKAMIKHAPDRSAVLLNNGFNKSIAR